MQIKWEHVAEHVLLVSMTAETGDAQKLVGRCRFIVFLRNLNTLILRFKYETGKQQQAKNIVLLLHD